MNKQSMMSLDLEAALGTLSSKIADEQVIEEYRERMYIDSCNINQCCIDQPELILDAVVNYESAHAEADYLKDMLAGAAAFLDPQVRELLTVTGEKITVASVEAAIKTHEQYRELLAQYHAAKANAGKWKAIMESARHRKDSLITIASNYRAEGNSEISLKRDNLRQSALDVLNKSRLVGGEDDE